MMNLMLRELELRYGLDDVDREPEGYQHLATLKKPPRQPIALLERLTRTVGRLRLVRRGSAA